MAKKIVNALPNRPLKHQEVLDLPVASDKILDTMPQSAPVNKSTPAIERVMIVTRNVVIALGFTDGEEWVVIHQEEKPDGAFEGAYISSEDHGHPEVQAVMEKMDEFEP